jgi:hypothetical protein
MYYLSNEALFEVVSSFSAHKWDSKLIREHAQKFGADRFKENMRRYIEDKYEEFKRSLNQCQMPIRHKQK